MIAMYFTQQVSVNHASMCKSCVHSILNTFLKHNAKIQQMKNVPGSIKILDLLNWQKSRIWFTIFLPTKVDRMVQMVLKNCVLK